MQWAVAAHGPAGKVHADRRTVEYFGRGNHARDAACFRTTRPVSAFPYAHSLNTRQRSESQRQQLKQKNAMGKSGAHRGKGCSSTAGSASGHGSARGVAGADERKEKKTNEDDEDEDVLSLSKLRMFYYETLVVSTRDDDANGFAGEDDSERDARAELDLLMARANAAAAAINSSTSNHHGTVNRATAPSSITATTPHPYLNARVPGSHLSWRERARRIVHANLRTANSLVLENSSSSDTGEEDTTAHEDDGNRMELDSVSAGTVSNNNGHEESFFARSTNGDSGRSFGIRQFLSSTSATSSGTGSNSNRHSRLLSLTSGANELRNSNNTQSRSRSGSNHSSTSTVNNNHGNSSNNNNTANGVHFAFTLSSRTLQQIRSRHERRRMRRHQEKKRFNHRIGVGFVLASKSNRDLIAHDGLSQISTSSSTISSHSISNSSSPLKKLSSYQQQKQVNHDDLGKDSFSLAYHGKTGRIMSNGQVFLQCERFGSGDVVGCGILLDTKTFFFTLNGRLLGMLAATDVHHFDDFVDDGAPADGIVIGDDDDEESDVDFEVDNESDEESDAGRQREGTLFENVLYPAVSLHDAGECACANFNEFRFDLAGFERQILKERQQALLLHEIADEREEEANDRVINKLIQDYFLHYGYKDAFTVFQKSTSFSQSVYSSTMDGDDVVTDMHIDEEEKSEATDTGNPSSSSLKLLRSAQTKLLNLRHAVRQHIYAFETNKALAKVRAALGEAFFLSATKRRRCGKVLFYSRVLCVLDVLLAQRTSSEHLAKAKAGNGNGYNGKQNGSRDDAGWNVEEAILCAQDQFSAFLTLTSTRTQASGDSDSIGMDNSEKSSTLAAQSVMDDELELVMSLLLYERKEDVPADSAARKFLSPKFREHVADELNVFLLINSSPKVKTDSSAHQRRRFSPPSLAAATGKDAFASALQNFLVERNSLQSQCLRNGCRVFPGNHTVSRSGGKRSSSRRRRRHASASSSDNGDGNGDEEMCSSSSGSDMSSSSSRSENDNDDDEDDEEEEE